MYKIRLWFLMAMSVVLVGGVFGAESVVVPIEMRGGRVMVPVEVNGTDSRLFMLDTGFAMTFLSASQADALNLKRTGQVTIAGIAGDEEADLFRGARFKIGASEWAPREVAAFPQPRRRRSRRRSGVLGSGLFKKFVVEVDPRAKVIRLHDPKTYRPSGEGEVLKLEFRRTTPIIRAQINIRGNEPIQGGFEVDTGCDGGLCLGAPFVRRHDLIALVGKTRGGGRVGVGGGVDTRVSRVPAFQMGKIVVEKAEANFFTEGSPVGRRLAGHVGSEILNQYRVVYDYSRRRMIVYRLAGDE